MYKLILNSTSIGLSDGGIIPENPTNADWQDYQDWLKIPGNEPLPADPEPTPEPEPEWEAFNIAFLADPNWQVISAQLPPQILMGVAASAATANAPALQSAYNIAKGAMVAMAQSIPEEALESWQAIAGTYHIPITF